MIRVVIAEDHEVVREGLRALFAAEDDLCVAGEAADGRETLRVVAEVDPDVLVLDLGMPGMTGLDVLSRLPSGRPRVVVLSMHAAPWIVRSALSAGASGYVVKGRGIADLVRAVRTVASGGRFLSPEVASIRGQDPFERLTPREREVLFAVGRGLSTKEIAAELGVSPRTVDTHREHIRQKLGLDSLADLIRFAIEHEAPR